MEGHTGYSNITRTDVSLHTSKAWKVHSVNFSNNAKTLSLEQAASVWRITLSDRFNQKRILLLTTPLFTTYCHCYSNNVSC